MKSNREPVFVYGASGHAKVVVDIIEKSDNYEVAFLLDDNPSLKRGHFAGYEVIGGQKELLEAKGRIRSGIVAIGDNRNRLRIARWLSQEGFSLATAVHPSAVIGKEVTIEPGTVIMAGAVINPYTTIGSNVIVNTRASIDHDCIIGEGVHIAPGATLCGSVTIGAETLVGAGSTIIQNITVGNGSLIGAGTTIYQDIPPGTRIVGPRQPQLKK